MGGDHMQEKPILIGLEDLYQGIPDESVNLTFKHLAQVKTSEKRTTSTTSSSPSRSMAKLPSLDFTKALRASNKQHKVESPLGHSGNFGDGMSYDDVSVASGRVNRRRRPGIPHSKICAICNTYVYIFRTRCLVCGRVYCRQCIERGMGEMVEGRKCIECLGLRFSQRYIERAGKVGCCSWRYPNTLKQAELKCAEKGPRRSVRHSHHNNTHSAMPNSRSPSPISHNTNEHSFVMSSSFSPFSPQYNLPL